MKKYKKGYIEGIFDMFCTTHLSVLENAKDLCEQLVVGIYSDNILENYGKKKPFVSCADRIRIIQAVRYVDEVNLQKDIDIQKAAQDYQCDVVFVGNESLSTVSSRVLTNNGIKVEPLLGTINNETTTLPLTPDIPRGRLVGYTTGVFDMFHIGHLNIIERAKAMCDYLIVGVSTDENVESYKHKKPVIPFIERASIIQSLQYVDAVVPQTNMDKLAAWGYLHFNVMFHGDDWKGSVMFNDVEAKLNAVGCTTIYLPHTDGISTSMIREKLSL